jgi:GR25 family glycosyltransferase involved in LPS biosynthesis
MKINCINLKRAVDRREQTLNSWKNFDIVFFDAIDKISIQENGDIIPYLKKPRIRELNYGERACATSHYLLLKKLLESDEEWIYIMEDDVSCNCTPESLERDTFNMRNECPNVSLFILHGKHRNCRILKGEINVLTTIPTNIVRKCWGTQFYMINRRGAVDFMNYIETMEYPIDCYWNKFSINKQIAFANHPYAHHIRGDTYIQTRSNYKRY